MSTLDQSYESFVPHIQVVFIPTVAERAVYSRPRQWEQIQHLDRRATGRREVGLSSYVGYASYSSISLPVLRFHGSSAYNVNAFVLHSFPFMRVLKA